MTEINPQTNHRGPTRVAVVGAGIVSPLGFGLAETVDALRQGRDCITEVTEFSVEQCRCKTAGQIPDDRFLDRSTHQLRRPERLHRVSRMMIYALEDVLTEAMPFQPELTVVGTTSGGMTFGEKYYRSLEIQPHNHRTPGWIANYLPQKFAGYLA